MRNIIIFLIILLAAAAGYHFLSGTEQAPKTNPSFAWNYHPFMDGEYPKTAISLVATYENAGTETKEIDTVDGSCNDVPDPDPDTYARSTMIICYAAGLGHYFKVVQDGTSFVVLRKTFEEGTPEYDPPDEPYEPVAQF